MYKKKSFEAKVSDMGRKKIINIPKKRHKEFEKGTKVHVIKKGEGGGKDI